MRSRLVKSCTITIATLACCGATNADCQSGGFPPPASVVVGAVVGVGIVVGVTAAVIATSADHAHHIIKGCAYNTSTGLELRTSDSKIYALSGATTNVAPGTTVKLHGNHQKPDKHDKSAAGHQVFVVDKLKKSYGPCTTLNASSPPGPPVRTNSPATATP